jgi:hypothetical protein
MKGEAEKVKGWRGDLAASFDAVFLLKLNHLGVKLRWTWSALEMAVYWVVGPCSVVEVYRRFRSYDATTQKTAIFIHAALKSYAIYLLCGCYEGATLVCTVSRRRVDGLSDDMKAYTSGLVGFLSIHCCSLRMCERFIVSIYAFSTLIHFKLMFLVYCSYRLPRAGTMVFCAWGKLLNCGLRPKMIIYLNFFVNTIHFAPLRALRQGPMLYLPHRFYGSGFAISENRFRIHLLYTFNI